MKLKKKKTTGMETEAPSAGLAGRLGILIKGGIALACLLIGLNGATQAATFGSIVQIQGLVSDIALDQARGVVYAANFTANRIEVVSMSGLALRSPIVVAQHPSSLALSPDGRFLVVGHYHFPSAPPKPPCDPAFQVLTVIDFANSGKQTRLDPGGACVLAVAFGNSPQALVVSTDGVRLLNPSTGALQVLTLTDFASMPLPVPWATFPPSILKASAGTSGDGKVIYTLVDGAGGGSWQSSTAYAIGDTIADPSGHIEKVIVAGVSGTTAPTWIDTGGTITDGSVTWQDTGFGMSIAIRYEISTGKLILLGATSDPPLGPRVVSVNQDGSQFFGAWALFDVTLAPGFLVDFANFPYPPGIYNQGSVALDWSRNLVYAQVAPGTIQATLGSPPSAGPGTNAPLLDIADSDNLTVEGIYQLRENLAGKSLLSSDFQTMYSISDSGLTVFPIGSLGTVHRVQATQQDLVFSSSGCGQGVIRQYVDIGDPGGGQTDFKLSVGTTPGITISPSFGTTPAHVAIDVDMTAFQAQKGTTVVPLTISSVLAVNVPFPVRLLINTRDPDQQGTVYDVPGTIVDVLADPVRNRFYAIRQDKNLVLVFNATTFQQIAAMRTGNTPVQMALTQDNNYLLVTNDNSQFASVFDLNALQPSQPPILFPAGYYPRSIAVSNKAILATSRGVPPFTPAVGAPQVHLINLLTRRASPPAALGIYINAVDATGTVLAASPTGGAVFMAMPDGTVALYEAQSDTCSPPLVGCGFVASRHDLAALSGAYAALSDNLFAVDVNVLNAALVPIGQVNDAGNLSSGVVTAQNLGLFVSAAPGSAAGVVERFDLTQLTTMNPVRTAECPFLASAFTTTPIGQIGQTILPFSRTLALFPAQSIVMLSTSGFTVLPWNYDAFAATPPAVAAVASAADGSLAVAPGGLISIYGTGLSASSAAAGQVPLPGTLASTCVSVNNETLPLLYASPNQINAQLPFDVTGGSSLVVRTSGGISGPFPFTVLSAAPAVFLSGTAGPLTGLPTIYRGGNNYSLVTLSNPIHPNDILVILATGMGPTSSEPAAGDAAPSNPLAVVTDTPVLTLGSAQLDLLYAGLAPGEVGVYQINAAVPWWVAAGMQVPLTISQGGQSTIVQVRVVKP